jgi:hypothetical protein
MVGWLEVDLVGIEDAISLIVFINTLLKKVLRFLSVGIKIKRRNGAQIFHATLIGL